MKSRKRYGGRKERARLNTFVLYLDENLCNCQEILQVLSEKKVRFKRHLDVFPGATKDPVFLPTVGRKGLTLLTCDSDMRRRGLEKQAILQNRVRMFAFTSNNLGGMKMAQILRKTLVRMRQFVRTHHPPFIASISEGGGIYLRLGGSTPHDD